MRSVSQQSGSPVQLPDWMPWLQAGFTAMLAVLFVVMVGKSRQQTTQLRELQQRVQGLENSRALERTTALEQQLRSTAERLQALERTNVEVESLQGANSRLRQELQQLRSPAPAPAPEAEPTPQLPASPPPLPPIRP